MTSPGPPVESARRPIRVACIIINWNGGDHILDAFDSICRSSGVTPRLIVIDNGSTDGSLENIRRSYAEAESVALGANFGVAYAWNRGLDIAQKEQAEYAFLLNDDAYVSDVCMEQLLRSLEHHPGAIAATPRIFDPARPGMLWYDGGTVTSLGETIHAGMGRTPRMGESLTERRCDFVTGCAVLIRLSGIQAVGAFDERFFAYCEDADWSFRARRKGYDLLHVPSAHAWHWQSVDTKKNKGKRYRDYYLARNRLMLLKEYSRGMRRVLSMSWFALRHVLLPLLYYSLTGQLSRAVATMRGVLDFLRGSDGRGSMQ
jgi:GT2 family glycosyltransferase